MLTNEERFDNFETALIALCREHKVCLASELYDLLVLTDAQDGIEDKDFVYTPIINDLEVL